MNKEIEHVINKVKSKNDLPVLSDSISVLSALADDEVDIKKLAVAISNYPEITARLVALANSAWSAPVKPITTIESACFRLGASVVTTVCIALSVSYHFDPSRCPEFDLEKYWTDSLLVADGAWLLASNLNSGNGCDELAKTARTAGLIHNIGLLWLAENYPKETGKAILMKTSESRLTLNQSLYKCLGTNASEVGGLLASQWRMPELLVSVLKYHLSVDYQGLHWEIVQIVMSAVEMVASLYDDFDYHPVNDAIQKIGICLPTQQKIYCNLANNLEKKRELVAILFR